MGFFDFLRKSNEKEVLVETLKLSEVEFFLDKKLEELNHKLGLSIQQTKTEISEEISRLKNNLENLANAELKNKEIPERAKQIMEGNRQIYIQKTNTLIEKIIFPEKSRDLLEFTKTFDKELDAFDKGISKSHHIMEEFFVEKASVIAVSIKKIDKLFKELKSAIESSDIWKIEKLKEQSSIIIKEISRKEENKNTLNILDKEIITLGKEVKIKEDQIAKFKQEDSYRKYTSQLNSKEKAQQELINLESVLRHSFSEIEPALKKYENLSQNKLAKKYLEDPLGALLEDQELEISTIFDAIKKAIIKGEITLKDTKKDRVMNELFILNKEFFQNFLSKRTELRANLSETTKEIENSLIIKSLDELEKSLFQDKASLHEKKSGFEKLNKDIETLNLSDLVSSLESEFKEKLNLNVKII
ncbi:hypothetical protein J4233_05980 [Candidatus Pacearchaeota archaeon]|nr:hypothetical protein [Candidatus Pacearchaeota archaeon]